MRASYYLVEDGGICKCSQICIVRFSNNKCIQAHSAESGTIGNILSYENINFNQKASKMSTKGSGIKY